MNIYIIILLFFIYSFLGYILEVIYCSYLEKKFVNRGFLLGPICPIYGVGSLLIIRALSMYKQSFIIVFVMSLFITSLLEYFISHLLEKVFHNSWWDYSYKKYNLNGRICLDHVIMFGIGGVFLIYIIDPLIMHFLMHFSDIFLIILTQVLMILLMIDSFISIMEALSLKKRVSVIESLKAQKIKVKSLENIIKEKFEHLKFSPKRLLKAFPNMLSKDKNIIEYIKKNLK